LSASALAIVVGACSSSPDGPSDPRFAVQESPLCQSAGLHPDTIACGPGGGNPGGGTISTVPTADYCAQFDPTCWVQPVTQPEPGAAPEKPDGTPDTAFIQTLLNDGCTNFRKYNPDETPQGGGGFFGWYEFIAECPKTALSVTMSNGQPVSNFTWECDRCTGTVANNHVLVAWPVNECSAWQDPIACNGGIGGGCAHYTCAHP
jgi:hypothetical protein